MKTLLIIANAKGGTGKTLIAHHYRQAIARLPYPPIFDERIPGRLPRPQLNRPMRFKNSTARH
jgi:hypothetical protein